MDKPLMQLVWEHKVRFFGTFFLVFFFSYLLLVAIDFVPEPRTSQEEAVDEDEEDSTLLQHTAELGNDKDFDLAVGEVVEPVLPHSIYIKKLDKTINVFNPTSRDIADLDAALLEGVVRHPDSAHLAQNGNVFILGHSSYLPSVLNSNFKAFNGIQDLEWGDTIEITSDSYVHVYQVEKVFKAKAQDVTVPIAGDEPRLTLATCNSFGSTDDRYIVEAKQIEVRPL